MDRLDRLARKYPGSPRDALLKCDLLFEGVRYTPALAEAGTHSLPGFRPYKPADSEGGGAPVFLPYFMTINDSTLALVRCMPASCYTVEPSSTPARYVLNCGGEPVAEICFQPRPVWLSGDRPAAAGLSQHGDMLVANMAPACEYWTDYRDGRSQRCAFCGYGAVSGRSERLRQAAGRPEIDPDVLADVADACKAAAADKRAALGGFPVRHIYMVGGSMLDTRKEAQRYLQAARALRQVSGDIALGCGSQALAPDDCERLKEAGVDYVCFNLELWDPLTWEKACPGKARYIGRDQWLHRMEKAVAVFGRGAVLSAFVSGAELARGMGFARVEQAVASSLEGARWMLERGMFPIFSPFSPVPGTEYEKIPQPTADYFITLAVEYWNLRRSMGLTMPDRFVCPRCMYAQVESDFDHFSKTEPPG